MWFVLLLNAILKHNFLEYIGFEAIYRRKHYELEKNIRIRDKDSTYVH